MTVQDLTTTNPTQQLQSAPNHEAARTAQLQTRELAEIQAQCQMARAFPRDESAAWSKLVAACARPSFADSAVYEFPRGGSTIRGLSVNAAREIARVWGNIRHGYRQIPTDPAWVHIEAFAFDLETGTFVVKEDRFLKRIQRKVKGTTKWVEPDERDLRELVGRRAAVLERNCMLELVPGDLKDEMLARCCAAGEQQAGADLAKNRDAVIGKMLASFERYGVSSDQIETRLGRTIAEMNSEDLDSLRRIFRSLESKEATVDEFFTAVSDSADEPGSRG